MVVAEYDLPLAYEQEVDLPVGSLPIHISGQLESPDSPLMRCYQPQMSDDTEMRTYKIFMVTSGELPRGLHYMSSFPRRAGGIWVHAFWSYKG
jgi:hypothetical protein